MRRLCVPISAALVLWTLSGAAAESSVESSPYPGAVALSQGPSGSWGYKSFPQLLPLYTFRDEPAGRSLCDRACSAVWPIVQADSNDKAVGLWTIVKRDDGRLQWAYKNRPVYTYFEDRPNHPNGVGKKMDWYLEKDGYAYLASVGVKLSAPLMEPQTEKVKKIQAKAELLQP